MSSAIEKAAPKVADLLKDPAQIARINSVIPQHLSGERMAKVAALAIHKTPGLANCKPLTLLGCVMVCASLGLEPNTALGHAYLIPFKDDVTLIIGFKGYIELMNRSPKYIGLHADVVYKGDFFEFEFGSNQHLRHRPLKEQRTGEEEWVYAHARLVTGEIFDVMAVADVLKIRDKSQGYNAALRYNKTHPWTEHPHEMMKKTVIRRLSKTMPLSPEFIRAAYIDAKAEASRVDFGGIPMLPEAVHDIDLVSQEPEVEEKVNFKDKVAGDAAKIRAETIKKIQTAAKGKTLPEEDALTLDLLRDQPDEVSDRVLGMLLKAVEEAK